MHFILKFQNMSRYRARSVWSPDPLKPLAAGTGAIQEVALKGNEAGYQSWLIECHVAKEQKAGTYQQDLVLKLDGETLSIKLQIEVWPWQVPDRVSFLPEMNCYGLPKNDLDYYRVDINIAC